MIGLSGTRVVVVDDNEGEALPIIRAFSQRGIPAAFFDGNRNGLPRKDRRLRGVRLAILDMVLAPGAITDDAKVSPVITTLERLLDPDNGPYAVLVWTAHHELRDVFETRLFMAPNVPKPILTVMVEKANCRRNGHFDLKLLSTRLDTALVGGSPLILLQAWEGKCYQAATDVTNLLSGLVPARAANLAAWRTTWQSELLQLMHNMAKAEAGQRLDASTFLGALYAVLNPLHVDRMESDLTPLRNQLSANTSAVMGVATGCGPIVCAKLNTMLHLNFDDLDRFFAGNVYKTTAHRRPRGAPTVAALLDDLLDSQNADLRNQLTAQSISVLVEYTAACDHAQKKIRVARFVAGVLVPDNQQFTKHMKTRDFARRLGPFYLETRVPTAGPYCLHLSARHVLTLDLAQAGRLHPMARLRGQAVSDLRVWLSGHTARPGIVML